MTDQADYPPLRPCPRCGGIPPKVELDPSRPFSSKRYRFVCAPDCGEFYVSTKTRAEAADKRNRRAKL